MSIETTSSNPGLRIGIDIGGTFTDFVIYDPSSGQIETFKLLSTPDSPADAVLEGLGRIYKTGSSKSGGHTQVLHGSTVATNALLERKGAKTALITTRGFRDVLQIGRQNRPELYDFSADPAVPLIPRHLRFEVDERVDHQGRVMEALEPEEVDALAAQISDQEVSSVAVCTLFSFLYPEHERVIAERLRQAGFLVSVSSDILPEYREYERMSTTTVNAYVSPVLDGYLGSLERAMDSLGNAVRLRVMQSNGGIIGTREARRYGVRCILSGPAGGVVGSRYIAERVTGTKISNGAGSPEMREKVRVITFDMGGTSTDVSLIDGTPQVTTEAEVGGCPIRIPMLDIHTIGAGGGSIAMVDPGGALRVGPQSAGADPGPACYGRGDLPTVTDANLVLGRLAGDYFLGGEMPLDEPRARQAIEGLGVQLGLSREQTALGMIEVVNAHMARALRVISVERGHDPRRFALLSFGGAGGLHAADLARGLGIPSVVVPPLASTLSAFGMLTADVVKDYTQTVMLAGDTGWQEIESLLAPVVEQGIADVIDEGVERGDIEVERFLDMRYLGQSYELVIPFGKDFVTGFHAHHERTYGYARHEAKIEIVNLRVRVAGQVLPPELNRVGEGSEDPFAAFIETREVVFDDGGVGVPFYRSEKLLPGNRIEGPAVVVRNDTTVLIPPGDCAGVDAFLNLIISIGATK